MITITHNPFRTVDWKRKEHFRLYGTYCLTARKELHITINIYTLTIHIYIHVYRYGPRGKKEGKNIINTR